MKNAVLTLGFLLGALTLQAQPQHSKVMDDGGTGHYKAVMTDDARLQGFTIYRPADLQTAAKVEGPLPVVLFGNGGCQRTSLGYENFLTDIASHGYVVLAVGPWNDGTIEAEDLWKIDDATHALKIADAKELVNTALNWLESENQRPGNDYYHAVNTANVAAMGQSCGGLQALIMGTMGDARIRTTVALNSGANSPGDLLDKMITKEDLKKLSAPIIYILGGSTDMATPNGSDDYRLIEHVPAVAALYEAGHMGTYAEPHGGTFAKLTRAWLNYQLKGDQRQEALFRYGDTGNEFQGWTIHSKNFSTLQTLRLYPQNTLTTDDEQLKINALGEVENIMKVTDPSITVSLPDADKATGTAVIICPGGALISLSWDSEFRQIAQWLNARGIAAIGLKYRLRSGFPDMSKVDQSKGMPRRITVTEFADIKNANANPSVLIGGDPDIDHSVSDALEAMRLVKAHAAEWHIDPAKIGYMGYSAGGGVAVAATVKSPQALMPTFLCSLYGPALDDVVVPENAPKLFIGVHADHPSVAAGCLALFLEWKKAGVDSELHIYGEGTGGLFGGGQNADRNTPNGSWQETFYSWLVANGWN
jgi:dienelactone hydrolase